MRHSFIVSFTIASLTIESLTLVGCGSSTFAVPVMRPAEINLGKLRKIAVGRVSGQAGEDVENDLINRLLEVPSFEVLDRVKLERIMQEHQISRVEWVDERTALEMGKFIGAAAFLSVRVSEYSYVEKITQTEPYKDKNGRQHTKYTRSGRAMVLVNFRITDLTTGRYVFSRELSDETAPTATMEDRTPPPFDGNESLRHARKDVVEKFVKKIAPHWENVNVMLLKDSDMPELEAGISAAQAREWGTAIDQFKLATERHHGMPNEDKAWYNLGVAYEYSSQFTEAIDALNQAYRLHPDRDYLAEITNTRKREQEYLRLQEQSRAE